TVPSASLAFAVRVIVAPAEKVEPSVGPVKLTVGGITGPAPRIAENKLRRPPDATIPLHWASGSALASNKDLMPSAVSAELTLANNAAAPATCGVAILVPLAYA